MPDADLILLQRFAQSRDEEAFAAIVQRYADMVFATCRRVLGDQARAEEAAQETFFLLFRKPQAVSTSVPGWLHRAATRLSLDVLRCDNSRRHRERDHGIELIRQGACWQDIAPSIDAALDELPEKMRTLLVTHFLEGVSQHELAEQLALSPATMSRRMKAALEALREKLKTKGVITASAALATVLVERAAEAAPIPLRHALGKMAMISGGQPSLTGSYTGDGPMAHISNPPGWSSGTGHFSADLMRTLGQILVGLALAAIAALILFLWLHGKNLTLFNQPTGGG